MPDPLSDVGENPTLTPKPAEPPKGKADLSSLEELKGKTLDEDSFAALLETVNKASEANADSRVTAAEKKWQKERDRDLAEGRIMSADKVAEMIKESSEQSARKADAKAQLVSTLAEAGIPAQVGDKKYDEFSKAYQDGLKNGQWTPEILVTAAGVRTIIAASGLGKKEAPAGGDDESRGQRTPPAPETVVRPATEAGKEVELSPDEKRQQKMRDAVAKMNRE